MKKKISAAKIFSIIAAAIAAFLLIIDGWGTVSPGERGVMVQLGSVKGLKDSGFYVKLPLIQRVHDFNVQVQKEQVDAASASKDLQTVNTTIALNFRVNPDSVLSIYRDINMDYKSKIIDPAIQESVKAATAQFTAEELVTKREQVRDDIKSLLSEKLAPKGIIVDDFNIVNFNFSGAFNQAIEAKVTAEQNALAAKNKLEQVKFEAQQSIAEAEGKAKAMSIESAALSQNQQILELRAIEKWDGKLPQVTGSTIPFINVK